MRAGLEYQLQRHHDQLLLIMVSCPSAVLAEKWKKSTTNDQILGIGRVRKWNEVENLAPADRLRLVHEILTSPYDLDIYQNFGKHLLAIHPFHDSSSNEVFRAGVKGGRSFTSDSTRITLLTNETQHPGYPPAQQRLLTTHTHNTPMIPSNIMTRNSRDTLALLFQTTIPHPHPIDSGLDTIVVEKDLSLDSRFQSSP